MKYLIAPSAYKGFFSPLQVAHAIADGIRQCSADNIISLAPIADGGDGTIEALQIATNGAVHELQVNGPLGEPVTAIWLTLSEHKFETLNLEQRGASPLSTSNVEFDRSLSLCVLELASACGLAYIAPERLNALDANTVGAGQLIAHCYALGYRNVVLAVGGSASTDGGTGILAALGARFLDQDGQPLQPGGRQLNKIRTIDLSSLENYPNLRIATDVTNPLLGDQGAARIFAPQKGASLAEVELLEEGLSNYADVLEQTTGKSAREIPGSGAAGGVPFGLTLALNAEIIPGFQWITSVVKLEEQVKESDIVISAEGSLDSQSISGKATGELARMCKQYNKRFFVIAGQVEHDVDWKAHGVELAIAAAPPGIYATLQDVTTATLRSCASLFES